MQRLEKERKKWEEVEKAEVEQKKLELLKKGRCDNRWRNCWKSGVEEEEKERKGKERKEGKVPGCKRCTQKFVGLVRSLG